MGAPKKVLSANMLAALDELRADAVLAEVARRRRIPDNLLRHYARREGITWRPSPTWRRLDDPVVLAAVAAARRDVPLREIAATAGVAVRTVQTWCYRVGLLRGNQKPQVVVDRAIADLRAGVPRAEVASRAGIGLDTLSKWSKAHGIAVPMGRPKGSIEREPVGIAAKVLRLHDAGLSPPRIAEQVDREFETVRKHLERWLPRRAGRAA